MPRYRGASRARYLASYTGFFIKAARVAYRLGRTERFALVIACSMPDLGSGILRFAQNDQKGSRGSDNPPRRDDDGSTTLSFRSERSAASEERNPGSLAQIAPLIYARTDGNALFMVNVVDYLVAQGPSLNASKIETPRNIRQMIERNLRGLDKEEQSVLDAASVAGAEFSSAAVAAALERPVTEIETRCTRLSRDEQFIRSNGASEWPDGTRTTSYRFLHALYQEALYERTLVAQRDTFHNRIATRQEAAWGERAAEIAAELADLYSRANAKSQTVKYFQLAGQRAAARSAMVEAERHYTRALQLLSELAESVDRDRRELELARTLAQVLMVTRGFAAPETRGAAERARDLAEKGGNLAQLVAQIFEIWRGVIAFVRNVTRQPLGWARARLGRTGEGITLIQQGLAGMAETGIRVAITDSLTRLAEAHALDGKLDDALSTIDEALLANPEALVFRPNALTFRGELRLKVGLTELAEADFREAIALAQKMQAKAFELHSTMSLARLLAEQGNRDEARTHDARGDLRLVHRGLRHSGPEGRQGPARSLKQVAFCFTCSAGSGRRIVSAWQFSAKSLHRPISPTIRGLRLLTSSSSPRSSARK
jgi:tetratricopeptide (TPR) repeat protein